MNAGKATSHRGAHAKAILGADIYAQLSNTKVLLVGAGGIGCELLKNIVLSGFGDITLLDLDTIDLSNLNRQFLFRKKDVKQSKAMVAAQNVKDFNPNVRITPIHANIKEPQFDLDWFQGFDIVLIALDNLDARRHVNKMCMAAKVPLVESGTAGYLGQVQPVLKDRTECFDCIPKSTPKTFPVCTIRSTPSQPIHCIVWAKSYLMPQLFGEDEDSVNELDDAEKQGENAQEIATLRKEAQAFRKVRDALRSPTTSKKAARMVFDKVYNADIRNLLSMEDMWRSRAPPVPLDFNAISKGKFRPRLEKTTPYNSSVRSPHMKTRSRTRANGSAAPSNNGTENVLNGHTQAITSFGGLKDQRTLTIQDNLKLFTSSTNRLASRLRKGEDTISFDKDDDDTLDFVTAASNLRSAAYDIEGKTRWEIKEMAGNIIPAIATTNAIISGLVVLQALQLLRKSYEALKNVHLQSKPAVPISMINVCPPNPSCGVCRDSYVKVACDPAKVTLREIVNGVLGSGQRENDGTGPRDVSVYEDKRVLSDPDWDDNNDRTLESLNVTRGKFLTIVDEDDEWGNIAVGLSLLPPNYPVDGPAFILPTPLPLPPRRVKPSTPPPPAVVVPSLKRPAPDDANSPSSKRPRTNGQLALPMMSSPSKKQRLEEDGLLMLESANDKLDDDDVIEID